MANAITVQKKTKTVDGVQFPSTAFAYVPDANKPSTWKLRLFDSPGDTSPSVRLTAAAVLALSPSGFRGNRVQLPSEAVAGVKRKVKAAWLKARRDAKQDVSEADVPSVLKNDTETSYTGLSLALSEDGQEAFSRLAGNLPVLAKEALRIAPVLDQLSKTLVMEEAPDPTPGYTLGDAEDDLDTVIKEISTPEFVLHLTESKKSLGSVKFAVPQTDKADVSTGDLKTQGGILVPASGNPKKPKERAGVFLRLPPKIAKLFPPKPEDESPPHATMLQLGELDSTEFESAVKTLQKIAKKIGEIDVELTDFGEFGNGKGQTIAHMIPRAKGETTFESLHMTLADGMEKAGFSPQRMDPFKPHVTIAYVEEGKTFEGPKPTGTFKLGELELWGEHGGEFGRVVVALGTGEIKRHVASTKKGADVEVEVEFKILSKADDEERTAFGVVLEPEEIDSQADIYSEDEVQKTAWRFLERYQQFGLMHKQIVPSVLPLESYLAPCDFELNGQKVKKGTWLLRVRVLDESIWKRVRSGELTGFSIGGSAIRTPELVVA